MPLWITTKRLSARNEPAISRRIQSETVTTVRSREPKASRFLRQLRAERSSSQLAGKARFCGQWPQPVRHLSQWAEA